MPNEISLVTLEQFTTFGDLLKFLRRRARLTQIELAIAVGYSEGQISRLEKGLRLPDPTTTAALFVPVLQLERETLAATRLVELARAAREHDAPAPGEPPYKGLNYFDETDTRLFYGRERVIAELLQKLNESNFLAIIGASGSGKSSIVRAGLAPALKTAGWLTRVITPTEQPLAMLAANCSPIEHDREWGGKFLIVVDQFEELFTLCHDLAVRQKFIDELFRFSATPLGKKRAVVIALRADFYAHCAPYAELRENLTDAQIYVGPMTPDALRRAIEEPAKQGGWVIEPGLVELLLTDVGGGAPEPGALPFLSHALLETWLRRRGTTMTRAGYQASGGVQGAIAETAESVFTDELDSQQQQIARHIFLRLTQLGDETEDTRRRASFAELVPHAQNAQAVETTVKRLTDARLLTTSRDAVEIAHEALVRGWPRLREWLNENRDGLKLHRQLTEAAHEWALLERDTSVLYRGARFAQAREFAALNGDALNAGERAFLEAAEENEKRQEREKEESRQRELVAAQKLAETEQRANKRLRQRALFLAGAFVLALVLAGVALFFGNRANENAVIAQQRGLVAEQQKRVATARELAASAIANLEVDAERSVLLALEAIKTTQAADNFVLPEAEDALHRAVLASRVRHTLKAHEKPVTAVGFSADGTRVVTADENESRVWDAATGKLLQTVAGWFLRNSWQDANRFATYSRENGKILLSWWDANSGELFSTTTFDESVQEMSTIAMSSDRSRIAVGYSDGAIQVRNTASGEKLFNLVGHAGPILDLGFSADGKQIASSAGGTDGVVKVWDAITGKETLALSPGADVNIVTFSPDGTRILTGAADNVARIWEISSGKELFALYGHTNWVTDIAYSPDGNRIATASWDRTVRVWDAATGRHLFTLSGHDNFLNSIAFSPDGQRLVTASDDKAAKVWDASPSNEVFSVDAGHRISRGDMNADGTRLVTGGRAVKVWDTSRAFAVNAPQAQLVMTLRADPPNVDTIFSPDGKMIAQSTWSLMGIIWEAETGNQIFQLPLEGEGSGFVVSYSPDGSRLVMSTYETNNCCQRVWDAKTGELLLKIDDKPAEGVAFTPDGKQLVTGNDDGTISIRDVATGKELNNFQAHGNWIWDVRFSPDGKRMITSSRDSTAKVWEVPTGPDAGASTWKELFTLHHTSTVERSEFSPDGTQILTGSNDGTAKLWNAATGNELLTLRGATSGVSAALFSPDGTRALTTSTDGAIRIYLLRLDDLIALAKTRVTRSLTQEECQTYLHVAQCP